MITGILRMALLLLTVVPVQACSIGPELPPRPPNVPPDAVRIYGSKTQWWVKCEYESGADMCTVFNGGGRVLWDNAEYRAYDGGPPVPQRDLRIDPKRSQVELLYLENGRLIVRAEHFEFWKRWLDAAGGQRR